MEKPLKQLRGKPLKDFLKTLKRPERELIFLLQDLEYAANVGSAFRIADACGVRRMVLTGITTCPPHPQVRKIARGRDRRVNWTYVEQADEALAVLKEEGFTICALELTAASVPYYAADYPDKLCLVVGHEDHGVTKRTLAACDMAVFIPMYGKGASLNAHVSLGVAAYHVLHNRQGGDGRIAPSEEGDL